MSNLKKLQLTVLTTALALGCAQELPPRSFVQPNVIKKTDLTGSWYYIQTVANAPPTNGSLFIGQSSSLMKVKFDIQEDYIYARRAYEQILGSEDSKTKDPANYAGQPLAAWKIASHFDIIRDYDSTTGEQKNKIIESVERPWNEREFIRVDWSMNAVTDYVGIGLDLFFSSGSPKVEPVSYWESDPTKPDALHLERNQDDANADGFAQGEATYLDITNKMVVTPDNLTAEYEENGQLHSFTYPKCFLYYEQDDCASQEVKVRHAFAKIGPQHDYAPRLWDGKQMELFGVWDVGLRRLAYNRQYGVTNSAAQHYAARFNIWEKSYRADGKTLIPPQERKLKKIPYFASGSQAVFHDSSDPLWPEGTDSVYPEELWPTFQQIVGQWNSAMKGAVKAMTGHCDSGAACQIESDCGGKGKCNKKEPAEDIFIACHNPVRQAPAPNADPAECTQNLVPDVDGAGNVVNDKYGNPVLHARPGDPRHSMVYWVNQQQNAGPLGYGPPLYDPETGETISGQAYIYGAALDTYATRSRDLMLLQNGEITSDDYTSGVNVQDYVNKHRFGNPQKPTGLTNEQVMGMSQSMDFDWAKGFSTKNGYPGLDTRSARGLRQSIATREDAIWNSHFSQRVPGAREAKLSRLGGTPLEKAMITPEMVAASGVSPMKNFDQMTEYEKARVSPMRWRALNESAAKERMRAEMIGVDFAQFDDQGLEQRLVKLVAKYGQTLLPHAEEIRQQLRKDIFLAVTLHEVGHNMGERHNFRGSYDSMNYFPDTKDASGKLVQQGYWSLRTQAADPANADANAVQCGKPNTLHARYATDAKGKPCIGGPASQFEIQNSIRETQYSSIMDYGAEFNSDLLGLGLYDKAFDKFSYAEYVEVFTDNKSDAASLVKMGSIQSFQNALGFPSALNGSVTEAIPYQSYPQLFNNGPDSMYKRDDVPYSEITSMALDNQGNVLEADSQGRPLVPYYFCSDEFAGNLTCMRFDGGADPYEQATDLISRYQNFYLYNNFKRDRASFHTSLAYKDRIASRYFDPLREQLTWYVLLRADFQSILTDNANLGFGDPKQVLQNENQFFADENGWGAFTAAVSLGFETIGNVVTTPEAGWHSKVTDATGIPMWTRFRDDLSDPGSPLIRPVDLIDGKYTATVWDFNGCGYYWAEECQSRIGYMVDKLVALDVLSQSQAYFTGRDTNADVRQYAIGYVIPFKAQLEEKFGALFANDYAAYAPSFHTVNGTPTLTTRKWVFDDPTVVTKADPLDPSHQIPKDELVDPATGFTVQLYAGVYGLSAFPTTFDHDFIDTTKVFVVGNGEASVPDANILAQGTYDPSQLVGAGATTSVSLLMNHGGAMSPKVDLPVTGGRESVALADLNGDGKTDLVVANSAANTVSVLINQGKGVFAPKVDYATGARPWALAVGDLNGDGKADIAVVNSASNTVGVFLNMGATFAAQQTFPAGVGPAAIAIGDVTGDKKPDLVVANSGAGTISVFDLAANGARGDFPVGTAPLGVVIVDLDGDKKLDVAVANSGSATATVLLNAGGGVLTPRGELPVGDSPSAIGAGDLDGDGQPELIVTSGAQNSVGVLVNQGAGTFAARVDYATGVSPTAVVVADLNGDMKLDLAVSDFGPATVSVFLNRGTGSFSPRIGYATGATPIALAVGDLDGDGKPDLVTSPSGNTLEWLLVKDPSGKIFAAHSTAPKRGVVVDTGAFGLPVDPLNPYSTRTTSLRNDQGVRMLITLKGLADANAKAQALADNDPNKAVKLATAKEQYEKFRENIEVMRSLQNAFGYGQYKTDAPFYY